MKVLSNNEIQAVAGASITESQFSTLTAMSITVAAKLMLFQIDTGERLSKCAVPVVELACYAIGYNMGNELYPEVKKYFPQFTK